VLFFVDTSESQSLPITNLYSIKHETTSSIKKNVKTFDEKNIIGSNIFSKIMAKKYSNCIVLISTILFMISKNIIKNIKRNKEVKNKFVFVTFKWLNQTAPSKPLNKEKKIIEIRVTIMLNRIIKSLDTTLFTDNFTERVLNDLFADPDLVLTVKNKCKTLKTT